MRRIIGNVKSSPKDHSRLLSRAGISRLLEYAVVEYDKARKARPQDPVLQSAFGFAYFEQRSVLYKPTDKVLRDKQNKDLFTQALDALQFGTTGKGAMIPFCWRALAYKSLSQQSGPFSMGVDNAKKALDLDPTDAGSYLQMAFAHSVFNEYHDPDKVLFFAKKAAVLRPEASSAYYYQAGAYRDKKQFKEALEMLQKNLSLLPPNLRNTPQAQSVLKSYQRLSRNS